LEIHGWKNWDLDGKLGENLKKVEFGRIVLYFA
jgi:hypothetical protein